MGKDWASPFFPPSLIFRSSIDHFVFWFMLLFHSILTFMKDLYQSEKKVFNPTRLLVLLHWGVGKDWAGPFFPPSKMFWSFYLSSRLLDYVILLLGWLILSPLQNVLIFQFILQTFGLCYSFAWLAHSFPPPKCSDLSIYPPDFWIMLFFCCIWTLLTYSKQRIKFSNQQVYL